MPSTAQLEPIIMIFFCYLLPLLQQYFPNNIENKNDEGRPIEDILGAIWDKNITKFAKILVFVRLSSQFFPTQETSNNHTVTEKMSPI